MSAGLDPSTGERIVLYETVPIADAQSKSARDRAEREAYKEAEKILTRLQAETDALKVGRTKATVGALLERWMIGFMVEIGDAGLDVVDPDGPAAVRLREMRGFYAFVLTEFPALLARWRDRPRGN